MEDRSASFELKDFVKKVFAIELGMLLVAGVVSLSLNYNFSIILFALGMVSAVVGASLGGADPYHPKNPRMQQSNPYEKPSAANLSARILYNLKGAVPQHAFENVLLFAGLIAILISMPFLCQIMF